MGDFLQWDPIKGNIQSDSDYLSDTMRLNGALAEIYRSNLHNKFAYQVSTMATALADALVNKGYSVSDASLATLTTVLESLAVVGFQNIFTVEQKLKGAALPLRLFDSTGGGKEWAIRSSGGYFEICENTGTELVPVWISRMTIGSSGFNSVPAGAEMFWPLETPPAGYFEEDGTSLAIASYPTLYGVLGTAYGSSVGYFKLPDARGLFPRVWAHGSTRDPDRATRTDRGDGTTGDHVGTLQSYQVQSHQHTISTYEGVVSFASNGRIWRVTGGTPYTPSTNTYGGNETRPINSYRMMIIKY